MRVRASFSATHESLASADPDRELKIAFRAFPPPRYCFCHAKMKQITDREHTAKGPKPFSILEVHVYRHTLHGFFVCGCVQAFSTLRKKSRCVVVAFILHRSPSAVRLCQKSTRGRPVTMERMEANIRWREGSEQGRHCTVRMPHILQSRLPCPRKDSRWFDQYTSVRLEATE